MKNKSAYFFIPIVAALVGCASPVPVAENFPLSYQKVARAVHHWDVIANDVIAQTASAIDANPVLQKRAIFVPRIPDASLFDSTFREFLITRMVNRGMPVSVCNPAKSSASGFIMDSPDVQILYDAKVIQHRADMPYYVPGTLTALAAGIAVARNAVFTTWDRGNVNTGIVAAGALLDLGAGHAALPTQTELLITTQIIENNRYIFRQSDVYYVPTADAKLFIESVEQRSSCPGENIVMSEGAKARNDARRAEEFRTEMYNREMRRVNEYWPR